MNRPIRKPVLGEAEARPYDRADGYEAVLLAGRGPRRDDVESASSPSKNAPSDDAKPAKP